MTEEASVAEGYRPFKIRSVKIGEKSITLDLEGSVVSLHIPHSKIFELLVGKTLWINGRRGNKDDKIQGMIDVEDIRLT